METCAQMETMSGADDDEWLHDERTTHVEEDHEQPGEPQPQEGMGEPATPPQQGTAAAAAAAAAATATAVTAAAVKAAAAAEAEAAEAAEAEVVEAEVENLRAQSKGHDVRVAKVAKMDTNIWRSEGGARCGRGGENPTETCTYLRTGSGSRHGLGA